MPGFLWRQPAMCIFVTEMGRVHQGNQNIDV